MKILSKAWFSPGVKISVSAVLLIIGVYVKDVAAEWVISTVDTPEQVGFSSSIAVDSNNKAHIASFRTDNFIGGSTHGDLRYATNASGPWVTSTIDTGILDTGCQWTGGDPSIAVDSNNNVHISYYSNCSYSKYASAIKYATNASGTWVIITVDILAIGGNSIAIDSNNKVHIAYFQDTSDGGLKYATNASGSWAITVVDQGISISGDPSIAIDSNNKVHISYYDTTTYSTYDLKYATNTSGTWVISTLDSTGWVGRYPSIAIDSNNKVHISYLDETNWYINYATNASGSWVIQNNIASCGGQLSMAMDSKNNVHISYLDGALKYATNASGSWVNQIVDSGTPSNRYQYPSIAIDSRDNVHISYQDSENYDLKYAYLSSPEITVNRTAACTPCAERVGEPVQTGTGEFFTNPRVDIDLGGPLPLFFSRTYASRLHIEGEVQSSLGPNWMHNFDLRLNNVKQTSLDVVYEGGKIISFVKEDSDWKLKNPEEVIYQLKQETNGDLWLMSPARNLIYHFSGNNGLLLEIKDRNENTLALTYDGTGKLAQVSDGLGRTLTFTFDASGNLTQISDGTRTLSYTYTNGVLTGFTDAMGNKTKYLYDTSIANLGPLLTAIELPLGNRHQTQTYDSQGRVIRQTDAYNNAFTYQYDTPQQGVTTITDPVGRSRTSKHVDQKTLTDSIDALGNHSSRTYDSNSRPTKITNPLGNSSTVSYDANAGLANSFTDAKGSTGNLTYSVQTQTFSPVTFTFYNISQVSYPDGVSESFTYDGKGNLLTRTDQGGNTWTYTYNSTGQVLTETNPQGGVTTYTYNADGTRSSSTDSDAGIGPTTYQYDDLKRLIKLTNPDGSFVQTVYNQNNKTVSVTDENNRQVTFAYDANGNLITGTDPAGNVTTYTYDAMDRQVKRTDRMSKNWNTVYDALGRIATVTDPNGNTVTYGYNETGLITQVTDGAGKVTTTGYDNAGGVTSATTPLGNTTTFQRDSIGLITKITDPLGNSTTFAYDSMSRLTSGTDALGRKSDYTYNHVGDLTGVTRTGLGSATYTRNSLGLLTGITDLNGKAWTFGYTPFGRPLSETDPLGNKWDYSYDSQGRLTTTTYPTGETKTITYDNAGNIIQEAYSDGTQLQYIFDSLNRLITANNLSLSYDAEGRVTNTADGTANFGATHDNGGRLSSVLYNNGALTVTYTYDARDLLTGVTDSLTGTIITFAYDNDGRLITINRSNGITTTYTYDAAGRTIRIQDGTIADQQYTLDAVGEITQAVLNLPLDPGSAIASEAWTFTFDDASRISSAGYSYDARGRQLTSPGNTFTWNGEGRLTGTGSATLQYNGMGDLRLRTEGSATTHYYFNYAVNQKPVMAEQDENNGQFLRYYVWTPKGQLLYMIDLQNGTMIYFYHFDRIGSTVFLTDGSGTVTDAYAYSPYGVLLAHNGTNTQAFTYIGKHGVRKEGTRGLYHMRERYYDATTARFLSRDPEWPNLHSPHELNPYTYAMLNPLLNIDPQGAGWLKELAKKGLQYLGVIKPTKTQLAGNTYNAAWENFVPGMPEAIASGGDPAKTFAGAYYTMLLSPYSDLIELPADVALDCMKKRETALAPEQQKILDRWLAFAEADNLPKEQIEEMKLLGPNVLKGDLFGYVFKGTMYRSRQIAQFVENSVKSGLAWMAQKTIDASKATGRGAEKTLDYLIEKEANRTNEKWFEERRNRIGGYGSVWNR